MWKQGKPEKRTTSFGFDSVPVHRVVVGVIGDVVSSSCVSTAKQESHKTL